MRLFIDSWRWQAVPIYLRAGKKLAEQATEIHILFKTVPYSIFPGIDKEDLTRNVLHLSIQKQEAMALTLHAKKPGPKLCMGSLTLCYDHSAGETEYPDAYARLLLDCQQEDQTLFVRSDVIESSWELFQGLLNSWKKESPHAIPLYKDGSDGPEESAALLRADGRKWILLH
jgi:glucose-6-phosphate 1-dehydrogenase